MMIVKCLETTYNSAYKYLYNYWLSTIASNILFRFNKIIYLLGLATLLGFGLHNLVVAESYSYDDAGRLISVIFDNGTSITYSYDNNGNLTNTIESDIQLASYTSDSLSIPVVSVGNSFYRVKLALLNPKTFEFQLSFYESLSNPDTATMSVFNNNILTIPEVIVDQSRIQVELTLTEASTFTFILTDVKVL